MALEHVKEDILLESEEQRKILLEEAHREAKAISTRAEAEIKAYHARAELYHSELVASMERKILAAGRLDAQRLVLNTKKEVLDAVRNAVKEKLCSLGKAERAKFLAALLARSQSEIDVDTVIVSPQDVELLSTTIKVKAGNLSGGIIAVSKDGTVRINLSLEQLLDHACKTLMVELNQGVFGYA